MCLPLDSVLACGKCVSPDYFVTEEQEEEESCIPGVRILVSDNLNDKKVGNVQICSRYKGQNIFSKEARDENQV